VGRGRFSWGFAVVLCTIVHVSAPAQAAESEKTAEAAEKESDARPARPVRWASAELNPLAMLAGLFGGQAQVGIAGPVTLQAGLSYFGDGQDVRCAGTDGCSTTPGAHGTIFEVGPRVFFPLDRPTTGRPPVYAWIGPAWGHNWMTIHAVAGETPRSSFEKNRAILDVGVHVPVGSTPVYLTTGVGYSKALDSNGAGRLDPQAPNLASSLFDGTYPSQYVANGTSIRVLFAVGAGF
jgi:hypothetical protein